MKSLILAVAILALAGCSALKKQGPSDLEPAIGLTLTPNAGKAPLAVSADIDVKNGYSCKLVVIANGVEGAPSDIPCKVTESRTFTADGTIRVKTKDAKGKEYQRDAPVKIQ